MARRPARPAVALLGSLLITVGVFVVAEIGMRVAGVEPREFRDSARSLDRAAMRVDPLLGVLPAPGWSGTWAGDFAVEVDPRGFRSAGVPPRPGRRRVVFMGDSCSFAWGVDTPETYVARLEERQREMEPAPFELINAAYPGHSAVTGVHMLREHVLPLDPDVVVLGFGGNNAFRLATVSDVERYRWFEIRKLVLRSRLLHVLAAWLADRPGPPINPRDRDEVLEMPLDRLRRVAAPDEFEAALRSMVAESRAAGATPIFLIFPRASSVSRLHRAEDAASGARYARLEPRPCAAGGADARELGMLETSCLDVRDGEAAIETIHAESRRWEPVYPDDPMVRAQIRNGAEDFVRGDLKRAWHTFNRGLGLMRNSPLATYDRGVIAILMGDTASGLRDLELADTMACNVFLHYQVRLWNIAVALGVPVVDLTLWFQSRDGEPLYLDPAHPNAAGQALIAEALWPTLNKLSASLSREGEGRGEGDQ